MHVKILAKVNYFKHLKEFFANASRAYFEKTKNTLFIGSFFERL